MDEMLRSETAKLEGIENIPMEEELENLVFVMHELQKARDYFYERPIIVTSGFRSKELNEKVNGASKSLHMKGKAADVRPLGNNVSDLKELAHSLAARMWEQDSLIYKIILEARQSTKWVHVEVEREATKTKSMLWMRSGIMIGKIEETEGDAELGMSKMIELWARA